MILHKRYRPHCLNRYQWRTEHSQNFVFPGNRQNPSFHGIPFVLSEYWNYAAGDFQSVVPASKWASTETGTHCQVFQNQVQVGFTSAVLTAIGPSLKYNPINEHGCIFKIQPEGFNISGNQIFQAQLDTDGANFSTGSNSVLLQLAWQGSSPGQYILEYFASAGTVSVSGNWNFTIGTLTQFQVDVGHWSGTTRNITVTQDGTLLNTLVDTGGPVVTQKKIKLFFQSQTVNPTLGFNLNPFFFYGSN